MKFTLSVGDKVWRIITMVTNVLLTVYITHDIMDEIQEVYKVTDYKLLMYISATTYISIMSSFRVIDSLLEKLWDKVKK